MSVNWVMLGSGPQAFVPLANEHTLLTSPPRTSIQLQSLNKYPGREPFHLTSNSGRVYLTNQRIIYLPDPTPSTLQSFAAPLLKVHDSRVTTPFFGPNAWLALVQPVPGGGVPSQHTAIELKLTFKDGGAYDFHTKFTQIKERLQQAADVAAESGHARGSSHAGGADLNAVHLEQLPVYEEQAGAPAAAPVAEEPPQATPVSASTAPRSAPIVPSDEPPPGYEEAQREALNERIESETRNSS